MSGQKPMSGQIQDENGAFSTAYDDSGSKVIVTSYIQLAACDAAALMPAKLLFAVRLKALICKTIIRPS